MPGAPGPETCNALDDDCNGAADDWSDPDGDGVVNQCSLDYDLLLGSGGPGSRLYLSDGDGNPWDTSEEIGLDDNLFTHRAFDGKVAAIDFRADPFDHGAGAAGLRKDYFAHDASPVSVACRR